MSLLRLSKPVQEQLLSLPDDEQARYPERRLRKVAGLRTEAAQARAFEQPSQMVAGRDGS